MVMDVCRRNVGSSQWHLAEEILWWFGLVNGAKLCGLGKDKGLPRRRWSESSKHPVVHRYIHLESHRSLPTSLRI
jgi:hypothetical protein